jgi:hypothetical protein
VNSDPYDACSSPGRRSSSFFRPVSQRPQNHISPSRRCICVICSALPHDTRTGFSFVTHPLMMDGPRHLQLQRHLVATPDRQFPSRPGTALSSYKSSSLAAPQQTLLSPLNSIRRGSSKRLSGLTTFAIPFFRRSSSQSVQIGPLRPSSPPPRRVHHTCSPLQGPFVTVSCGLDS